MSDSHHMKVPRETVERLFCAVLPAMLDRGAVFDNLDDDDGVTAAISKSMEIAEKAAAALAIVYGSDYVVEVEADAERPT